MLTHDGGSRTRPRKEPRTGATKGPSTTPPRRAGSLYLLLALVAVLCLTGVVMVLSASSVLSIEQYGSPWHFFIRQLMWLVVGAVVFLLALRTDRRRWRRLARPAMVTSVVLLLMVLVPHIGKSSGGASRWIGPTSLQIQPSEFAKLALILFAADVMDRRNAGGSKRGWWYEMGPAIAAFVVVAVLILKQPDMGTTLVLGLILMAMLFTAGLPGRAFVGLLGTAGGASLLLAVADPYRWRRMTAFLHPLQQASNAGFQTVQGFAALAQGGVAGDGIGSSIASWGYLPNAQTDFIFAIIGEEAGLAGTLLLSGLFFALALVGVRIACGAKDRFSGLLATGITAWLVGQAVVNIGAVVGLLPVTGVPLPFISYGGSSLVIAMFGAGVLGNIARNP